MKESGCQGTEAAKSARLRSRASRIRSIKEQMAVVERQWPHARSSRNVVPVVVSIFRSRAARLQRVPAEQGTLGAG